MVHAPLLCFFALFRILFPSLLRTFLLSLSLALACQHLSSPFSSAKVWIKCDSNAAACGRTHARGPHRLKVCNNLGAQPDASYLFAAISSCEFFKSFSMLFRFIKRWLVWHLCCAWLNLYAYILVFFSLESFIYFNLSYFYWLMLLPGFCWKC